MAQVKKKKKVIKRVHRDQVDPILETLGHHPYFVKKAEEMKAFLRKHPPPPGVPPFEG